MVSLGVSLGQARVCQALLCCDSGSLCWTDVNYASELAALQGVKASSVCVSMQAGEATTRAATAAAAMAPRAAMVAVATRHPEAWL